MPNLQDGQVPTYNATSNQWTNQTPASGGLPSYTTTQRDALGTPPSVFVIYNTTLNIPQFWNGSSWKDLYTAPAPTPTFAGATISQTISSNLETNLNSWSSQVATGITVGVGISDVFTTPTAGWYSLGFSLEILKPTGGGTNFETAILKIKQGGAAYHALQDKIASSGKNNSIFFGGSILIQMSASQTISMTTQVDRASSYEVTGMILLVKVD